MMRGSKPAEKLLSVENLSVILQTPQGEVPVVDDVSFTLERGKTLGLVGESGCGKTMTAYALMALLPRKARVSETTAIRFQKQNLAGMKGAGLRQLLGKDIAMVFQDPMTSLNPVMTIGRQITEVLRHHLKLDQNSARDRAVALLERVGIPLAERRLGHYPHQLSGGLRQRVAIAIALACEPDLLIADEPTTALDVTVQAGILDLIARLQKENQMAIILISHDLNVVAGRTHETAVMYAGRIVEQAPTDELYDNTLMPYTRALMDAVPRMAHPPHTRLRTIGGYPPALTALPPGCRFAPRCPRAAKRCAHQEPTLRQIDGQRHRVACWYPLSNNPAPGGTALFHPGEVI